jgi:hypothetical protein
MRGGNSGMRGVWPSKERVGQVSERHGIESVVRIVRLEYDRCGEFGMTPAPEDYRIAIEHWLRFGELPSQVAESEAMPHPAEEGESK